MPILARAFILLMMVLLVVGGVVFGVASRRVGRIHDIPPPPIARATSTTEIGRGARLFRTNCLDCHSQGGPPAAGAEVGEARPDDRRASGGRVTGAPSFLGEIWGPNLTADVETGIGGWTDGELARLLRNGLRRDGRYAAAMPRFARLADDDVAALIGFLRSTDPLIVPTRNAVPRPGLDVAGTLALAFAAGVDTTGDPHVAMPPRGATAAYGRYLASAVYGCVDCHTEGFRPVEHKLLSPMLLAGGQFHRTPRGEPIYSSNLTPDVETGLGKLTGAGELARLLTTGIRGDGLALRPPMPIFRFVDEDEAGALFAFLRTLPPVSRKTPGPARIPVVLTAPPQTLFATLGCTVCHGDGAPHRELLKKAASVGQVTELAARIRHPEQRRPDSQMPTYAAVLDDADAVRLAQWIKETGGGGRPQQPDRSP